MEVWVGLERRGDQYIPSVCFTNLVAATAWMEEPADKQARMLFTSYAYPEWPPGSGKTDINDPAVMNAMLTDPSGTRVR